MKRSEFVLGLANDCCLLLGDAEQAARKAEEAGVQWDPEEPELPGDLELEREGPGVMISSRRDYSWLVDLSCVDRHAPMEEAEIKRLDVVVSAANRLPALEALARELTKAVKVFHDGLFPYCPECKLVRRARDLGLLPEED